MSAADAYAAKKRVRGEPFQIASEMGIVGFKMSDEPDDERFFRRQIKYPLVILNPLACFNDYGAGDTFWHGECFVVVGHHGSVKDFVVWIWPRHTLWPGGFVEMCMCINNRHFFSKGIEPGRALLLVFIVFLAACDAPDSAQQRRRELQRDAVQLRMGQALNPIDAAGYIQLGAIYHQLGEYENALNAFQTALALDESHPHAYNNMGLVYLDLRLYSEAISMFQGALEIAPVNAAFLNNLGYAYDSADRFDEALDAYRRALEADATFVDAYANLGEAYLNREMYAAAIQSYEQALVLDDSDATVYFNLGLAYEESGEFLRAIQAYEKGLALDNTEVAAYYRLAHTYQKNGNTLMMRRYLDDFLERAEGIPHLEEQFRAAQQMKDAEGP